MPFPMNNQSYVQGNTLDLLRSAFEFAKMIVDECEKAEKRDRYDDNLVKAVSNATRLYEQGAITHQSYMIIIAELTGKAQALETSVRPVSQVQQPNVSDLIDMLGKM